MDECVDSGKRQTAYVGWWWVGIERWDGGKDGGKDG